MKIVFLIMFFLLSAGKGHKSDISGLLQQTFLGSKTQQQMEANPGHTEQISEIRNFQNGK